jgi:hypothetical protein
MKGLIIREPWIGMILDGSKTWGGRLIYRHTALVRATHWIFGRHLKRLFQQYRRKAAVSCHRLTVARAPMV